MVKNCIYIVARSISQKLPHTISNVLAMKVNNRLAVDYRVIRKKINAFCLQHPLLRYAGFDKSLNETIYMNFFLLKTQTSELGKITRVSFRDTSIFVISLFSRYLYFHDTSIFTIPLFSPNIRSTDR